MGNHSTARPGKPFGFFKTTLLGALLIVVPIGIIGFALLQVVKLVRGLLLPVVESLPFDSMTLRILLLVAALLVVILLCYFTGLLVRTRWGRRLRGWVERSLLDRIPGYKMVRSLAHQYLGEEDEQKFRPVMVDLYASGTKMIGLEIEELGDGTVAVFLPSVPAVTLGQVHIVPEERVTPIPASLHATVETLTMFGEGASKLIVEES
jgi:uncharacterized membrane protein